MNKILNRIRAVVASARASQPLGAYIPNNKVVAGAVAAGLVYVARTVLHVDLPAGLSEAVAGAIVGYLVPESPVAAAHVVLSTDLLAHPSSPALASMDGVDTSAAGAQS